MPLHSALGPHCVGVRVVVRHVVRGESGPSQGLALNDVLGVMESWGAGVTTIRTEKGVVTVAIEDIVAGKAVPPRPSSSSRLDPDTVERRALAGWPATETQEYGGWVLRASGGYSSRANSVLAVGAPQPVDPVLAFYAARGLPAWAQVVVGSPCDEDLARAGWVSARPGEADSHFQVAPVARARRNAGPVPEATFSARAWPDVPAAGRAVMEGPAEVGFCSLGQDARGRVSVTRHGVETWAGITDVWVSPDSRGRGLGRAVMAALLDYGAERGAGTAYLQTRGDNAAALGLYDSLGFVTHHTYRYLTMDVSGRH